MPAHRSIAVRQFVLKKQVVFMVHGPSLPDLTVRLFFVFKNKIFNVLHSMINSLDKFLKKELTEIFDLICSAYSIFEQLY